MQPHKLFCKSWVCGVSEWTVSTPTTETSLILATVDFEGKYTTGDGQGQSLSCPTVPLVGPETYLEILEGLLEKWSLGVSHWGDKDTDSRDFRKISLLLFFILLQFYIFFTYFFLF